MILIMDREVVKKYSGECEGVGGSKERETHRERERERERGGGRERAVLEYYNFHDPLLSIIYRR